MLLRPLVTVGIPAFDRAYGLSNTLHNISTQTYPDVEIVISDNASSDPRVEQVSREWQRRDPRIRYTRQSTNLGPVANFLYVLSQARGELFMWAADDDNHSHCFIESTAAFLLENPDFVAASMEAQYVTDTGLMPYVPEGRPFYDFYSASPYSRMQHMLSYNYGNIVYGLYRRNVLQSAIHHFAHNEVSLLIAIAAVGNWAVLPQVGLFKQTTLAIYDQVCWENRGGRLPNAPLKWAYFRNLPNNWRYHSTAGRQIALSIRESPISFLQKSHLICRMWLMLFVHFLYFVFRCKPRRRA